MTTMKRFFFLLLSTFTLLMAYPSAQAETSIKSPLPAKAAFVFTAQVAPQQTLVATWKIAPNYYLYRKYFDFKVLAPKNAKIQVAYPDGVIEEHGKTHYEIYRDAVIIPIAITNPQGTPLKSKLVKLMVRYQGCSEDGFCYPPTKQIVNLDLNKITVKLPENQERPTARSDSDRVMQLLMTQKLGFILLGFLGFGLLLAFTPCVLPMLPILSAIIVGQNKEMSTLKAFKLSLVYVLGMAVNYALIGVLAGLLGSHFQQFFQAPLFLLTFSLLFTILAFSLFGFYELQLPQGLQQRITHWSNRHQGGTYLGVGVMGFLSTLIVSPCVTAPLVGALGYIGRTGDAMLGGAALFTMGVGMGIPLMVFGTSEGKLLPKAGHWMKDVKSFFGFSMLAVALDLMQRILPDELSITLWIILAVSLGIYLIFFSGISHHQSARFWRWLGVIPIMYGVLLGINLGFGIQNMQTPLAFLQAKNQNQTPLAFHEVKSISELTTAIDAAKASKQWVMLDFSAKWCVACQEMEHTTFAQPRVKQLLKNIVLLRVDLTDSTKENQALQDALHVIAPPTILFFNPQAKEEKSMRVVGEMDADEFVERFGELAATQNPHKFKNSVT